MDKLKPLIEHHFWILFFLVLLLPVIGWWPTANGLRDETEKQISTIDSAFSAVPTGNQANQSWSKELNKIAEKAEEQNQEERVFLWDRQWKMMTWPNSMLKKHLPDAYRDVINLTSRNVYKGVYDLQVEKVWRTADPFDPETGKGTVLLDLETVPRATFGNLTPTSEELWDAQEDLWLLESLFKSIKDANQGASNLSKSVLRRIDLIELVGGPGNYPDAEPSSGSSDSAGFGGDEGPDGGLGGLMYNDEGGGGEGGGFGERNKSVSAGSVSFDPSDEFGEEQGRYIDFEEGTIYRKRGFYLEGIVDHERLPDLLVALSNGNWPVTITRVQMVKLGSSGKSSSPTGGFQGGGFQGGDSYGLEESMQESEGTFGQGGGGSRLSNLNLNAGRNSRSRGARTGKHAELARAAVIGNSLAKVAISGVIYICNPPDIPENDGAASAQEEVVPEETMEQPEPETPASPGTSPTTEKQETPANPASETPAGSDSEAKKEKPDSEPAEPEKPTEDSKNAEKKPAAEPIPKPKAESP